MTSRLPAPDTRHNIPFTTNEPHRLCREDGFTLLEMVVAVAIISIVVAWAIMGITTARANARRTNAVREMASFLEEARTDSIRRRATGGSAGIYILNGNTYRVVRDFNQDGNLIATDTDADGIPDTGEFRDITLPDGASFHASTGTPNITFDFRGRLTTGNTPVWVINEYITTDDRDPDIMVSGLGDVTVGGTLFVPTIETNPNLTGGVTPTPTPTLPPTSPPPTTPPPTSPPPSEPPPTSPPPTTPPPTSPPPSEPPPTSPPPTTPPPTSPPPSGGNPTGGGCSITSTPSAVTVRKNGAGGSVGTVTIRMPDATTSIQVTAQVSHTNEISATSGGGTQATVAPGGSVTFGIRSLRNNAGSNYQVTFNSSCGSTTVTVIVVN